MPLSHHYVDAAERRLSAPWERRVSHVQKAISHRLGEGARREHDRASDAGEVKGHLKFPLTAKAQEDAPGLLPGGIHEDEVDQLDQGIWRIRHRPIVTHRNHQGLASSTEELRTTGEERTIEVTVLPWGVSLPSNRSRSPMS
jgi:hypothetical protein